MPLGDEQQIPEKPASQESDLRSVAAFSALKARRHLNFTGVGGCWCSSLLSLFGLFQDKITGEVHLSLGFQCAGALMWRVNVVQDDDVFALNLDCLSEREASQRVSLQHEFHVFEDGISSPELPPECFEGIPWDICN